MRQKVKKDAHLLSISPRFKRDLKGVWGEAPRKQKVRNQARADSLFFGQVVIHLQCLLLQN